jgi:hypothetical protein
MEQPEEQGFELVFGPRQIGAVLFVAVAVVGICSAIAYVAGKTAAAATRAQAPPPPIVAVTPPPPPQVVRVPAPPAARESEPPRVATLFQVALPNPGETYLQVAAVPKGVADVYAAGFTAQGRHAVLAPASTEAIVRVLVGPFRDKEDMAEAKTALQTAGFNPFVREYTSSEMEASNPR